MFLHSFRYNFLTFFRTKEALWWNMLFPIVLSSFFHMAFTGISSDEQFHAIPVAVVLDEASDSEGNSSFRKVIETLSESGENQFLEVIYATEDEALSLLEKKEITGILYEGTPMTLSVSAEMTIEKLDQSILSSFVEQYNMQYTAIEQIAKTHPENLMPAINVLTEEVSYNLETSYSDGDMDMQTTYFFNLLAMTCLFAGAGGVQIAIANQANLSSLGARKNISPVNKFTSLLSALCATSLFQFLCAAIGLFYMVCILKVNFGNELGYVLLAILIGCINGVSFGFCIGCIGHLNENVKSGIQMAVTMICSFLSGLMIGNMRILVQEYCPWFNHVNPAALISDSFYALTIYQSHDRYWQNSLTLLSISALFFICGFLMVRRDKYAAL